ncbi:MAG: hypothetical protein ABI182_01825 [Candidatus Baltobacteraceae bacterium]
MLTGIEFDGVQEPDQRALLLAFVNEYCTNMTLAQAREWFDDVRIGEAERDRLREAQSS